MNIENKNLNIKKEDAVLTGVGAVAGGVGAKSIRNAVVNSLSRRTVKALGGNSAECDAFVKSHAPLMKKTLTAKKGFFGKLNNALRNADKTKGIGENVKAETENILKSYKDKAVKRLGSQALDTEIAALENKYMTRDVAKSIKSVSKLKSALFVSGAALFCAVAINAAKEIAINSSAKKLLQKTEKEVLKEDIKPKKQENEALRSKTKKDTKKASIATKKSVTKAGAETAASSKKASDKEKDILLVGD